MSLGIDFKAQIEKKCSNILYVGLLSIKPLFENTLNGNPDRKNLAVFFDGDSKTSGFHILMLEKHNPEKSCRSNPCLQEKKATNTIIDPADHDRSQIFETRNFVGNDSVANSSHTQPYDPSLPISNPVVYNPPIHGQEVPTYTIYCSQPANIAPYPTVMYRPLQQNTYQNYPNNIHQNMIIRPILQSNNQPLQFNSSSTGNFSNPIPHYQPTYIPNIHHHPN